MAGTLFVLPKQVPLNVGVVVPGAKLYFYLSGTSTPVAAYTTPALDVAHASPVVADADGVFAPIYLDSGNGEHRVKLTDAADVQIWQVDNVPTLEIYGRTAAEISAGVTPVNYQYPTGNVLRYGTNTTPGTTDMTAAIQAALNSCPQYGDVYFPGEGANGVYLISSLLTCSVDNIKIHGKAKIKASSAPFAAMLTCASRTGVVVQDLEFDINGSNRKTGQTTTLNAISFSATTDCAMINVTIRNSLGYSSSSATAVAASGNCLRFKADGCKFIDCGESATSLPSDGLFVRGDHCEIVNCQAYRCTDTAYVLEGCNYSMIGNCIAVDCTAIGAVSNDTATDSVGNEVNGLTGSNSYVGSTGGTFGVACFGAGDILQTKVSGLSIRYQSGATGLGPGIQVRTTSTGRVNGLQINDASIDIGSASGVLAQAMLIQDSDNVIISNPFIVQDLSAGSDCIKFDDACVGAQIHGGRLIGGTRGVSVTDTSSVLVQSVRIQDQDDYGISAGDTSVVTSRGNTITGASLVALENKAAGATLLSDHWQAWTPTYSSDVGNAAATFNGSVTTTLARYSVNGKVATVNVYYTATLNAVTPGYIELTLPGGVLPQSSNQRTTADVSNNSLRELGVARSISTGSIRVYRSSGSNYGSGVAVEGAFCFSFEIE